MVDYVKEAEARIQQLLGNSTIPMRKDETLLPVPNIRIRKFSEF